MSAFITYMFALGLATSLHCVSMCGPLVLTYAVKGQEDGPWYKKITPNVAYQGAKVVSYMLVGLLLGGVGSLINFDAFRPYVMFLAGAFMIVLGLGMTGKVPWAARFTPRPPKWLMNVLVNMRRKSNADAKAGDNTLATPVMFGLMTGLLPCGPLMAAQVSAATSGSPLLGAAGMAAFALGTAPFMVAFGTAGSLIPRNLKHRMMALLAVGVIIFGFVFIDRGLMMTGSPVTFNTIKASFVGGPTAEQGDYAVGDDGVVEVPLVIENVRFVPQAIQIPEDQPVRLIVDRREAGACSDELWLPQLGVRQPLTPNGVTIVDIPATAGGSYSMTCQMGMMSGQMVVGDGSAGGGGSPLAWLVVAIGAAGGALYFFRSSRQAEPASQPSGKGGTQQPGKAAHSGGRTQRPSGGIVEPDSGTIFGFSRAEVVAIGMAVAIAIFAGLTFGGMFT